MIEQSRDRPRGAAWIFVVGARGRSSPPDQMLRWRIEGGYWPLGERTKGASRLSEGDLAIFYLAGRGNRVFIGEAVVASRLAPIDEVVPPDFRMRESAMVNAVRLDDARVWQRPVDAERLVPRLHFIGNKVHWMARFAVGLIAIGEEDERVIRSAAVGKRD
jgi:hypothetical protein